MRAFWIIAAALVWLSALACTEETTDSGPQSRGEACQSLGAQLCDKLLGCNLTFTDRALCIDLNVKSCCERAGTCQEELAEEGQENFTSCQDQLEQAPCDTLQSAPPPACVALQLDF